MQNASSDDGRGKDVLPIPTPTATIGAFLRAIERVEQVIDQETDALRQRQPIDLADFNRRKSHGLLELTRGVRGLEGPDVRQVIEEHLRPLRVKLQENSALLRRHLDAVQEISGVLSRAIRDGESDGTYSAAVRFIGGAK